MTEQQKQIIEHYIAAYNDFDIDRMLKDLHPELIFENISNGEVNLRTEGLEEFRTQANAVKAYFKEREQTIVSWDFSNDKVLVDIGYKAILAIELPNGMKEGDLLELQGQSEFHFKEDKIIGIRDIS